MVNYFNETHFDSYRIREPIRQVIYESRTFRKYSTRTSVFISHKHDDLNVISGFLGFLRSFGVDTYIDAFDPLMPNFTCGETARRIKERIEQCDKFMFLATDNAIASKWCNWELGVGDVHKYKADIAIVPVKNTLSDRYTGSEFLDIYPYLKNTGNGYFIYYPEENSSMSLKQWLTK